MENQKKALVYGLLMWFVPFAVSFAAYPLKENAGTLMLFESIMAVSVVACAVVFSVLYFRDIADNFIGEGIYVGWLWLAICVVIDLPLFMGVFEMQILDYIMDIGVSYLVIPAITIGFGHALENRKGT